MVKLPKFNRYFPTLLSTASQAGQSIVEVLVATAVVAVVMTAIAAAMTVSVKNTAQAKYRSLGTQLAQENLEVFRRERDRLGWETFYEVLDDDGSIGTYCFSQTLPTTAQNFVDLTATASCENGFALVGTTFTRSVQYQLDSTDQVTLRSTVTWLDADNVREVELVQQLTNPN